MSSVDDLQKLIKIVQQLKGKRSREVIAAVISIFFGSILGLISIWIFKHYQNPFQKQVLAVLSVLFGILCLLTFTILLALLIWILSRNLFRAVWKSRNYKNEIPKISDWKFQGRIGIDSQDKAIWLTDSDAGCYLHSRSWKSCQITFQAKCENDSGFGILFRVQDPEHYWMFKINPIEINGQSSNEFDHFRTERGWQILTHNPPIKIDKNKWVDFSLLIEDEKVSLKYDGKTIDYQLPHFIILNRQFLRLNLQEIKEGGNILTIQNKYSSGSFGFRAIGNEKVYFRNLTVINPRYKSFRLTK